MEKLKMSLSASLAYIKVNVINGEGQPDKDHRLMNWPK